MILLQSSKGISISRDSLLLWQDTHLKQGACILYTHVIYIESNTSNLLYCRTIICQLALEFGWALCVLPLSYSNHESQNELLGIYVLEFAGERELL